LIIDWLKTVRELPKAQQFFDQYEKIWLNKGQKCWLCFERQGEKSE